MYIIHLHGQGLHLRVSFWPNSWLLPCTASRRISRVQRSGLTSVLIGAPPPAPAHRSACSPRHTGFSPLPASTSPRDWLFLPLSSSVNRGLPGFDHPRNEMKPSGNPSGSLERQKARCGGDNGLRLCILGPCSPLLRSSVRGLRALLQCARPLAAPKGSLGYSHDLVEDHFYASP